MKQSRILVLGAAIAFALAACKGQDEVPAADTATAPPEAAAAPAPKPVLRDVLKAGQVSVVLVVEAEARVDAAKGVIEIPLKVTNNGQVALSGKSNPPTNIGVQIVGDDGTTVSAGGVRDFSRTPLPEIEPGASASVLVSVPADARANGRKLRIDLVQEGNAWFSNLGQPTVEVGPFEVKGTAVAEGQPAADPNMRSL